MTETTERNLDQYKVDQPAAEAALEKISWLQEAVERHLKNGVINMEQSIEIEKALDILDVIYTDIAVEADDALDEAGQDC